MQSQRPEEKRMTFIPNATLNRKEEKPVQGRERRDPEIAKHPPPAP